MRDTAPVGARALWMHINLNGSSPYRKSCLTIMDSRLKRLLLQQVSLLRLTWLSHWINQQSVGQTMLIKVSFSLLCFFLQTCHSLPSFCGVLLSTNFFTPLARSHTQGCESPTFMALVIIQYYHATIVIFFFSVYMSNGFSVEFMSILRNILISKNW